MQRSLKRTQPFEHPANTQVISSLGALALIRVVLFAAGAYAITSDILTMVGPPNAWAAHSPCPQESLHSELRQCTEDVVWFHHSLRSEYYSMTEHYTPEVNLVEELLVALNRVPGATVEQHSAASNPDQGFDAVVDIRLAGKPISLLLEARKTLHPRDVRAALWNVREASPLRTTEQQPMLIAQSISPGAKELLQQERVAYFASGGSLFLPVTGAYVFVDAPPTKSAARSIGSLFKGRRAQVLHALLTSPPEWFGISELAKLSEVAASTASEVITELERREWLESRGQGPNKQRRLQEPGELLDAWAEQMAGVRRTPPHRYFVPRVNPSELIDRLAEVLATRELEYAISFETAAQHYAPFVSTIASVQCWLADQEKGRSALQALHAQPVLTGANLVVHETKSRDPLLFRNEVDGAWLASPIRAYLDLVHDNGRSKEMAEHLRRERIGF